MKAPFVPARFSGRILSGARRRAAISCSPPAAARRDRHTPLDGTDGASPRRPGRAAAAAGPQGRRCRARSRGGRRHDSTGSLGQPSPNTAVRCIQSQALVRSCSGRMTDNVDLASSSRNRSGRNLVREPLHDLCNSANPVSRARPRRPDPRPPRNRRPPGRVRRRRRVRRPRHPRAGARDGCRPDPRPRPVVRPRHPQAGARRRRPPEPRRPRFVRPRHPRPGARRGCPPDRRHRDGCAPPGSPRLPTTPGVRPTGPGARFCSSRPVSANRSSSGFAAVAGPRCRVGVMFVRRRRASACNVSALPDESRTEPRPSGAPTPDPARRARWPTSRHGQASAWRRRRSRRIRPRIRLRHGLLAVGPSRPLSTRLFSGPNSGSNPASSAAA